jgi:iron uptake system component EfeO
LLILTSVRPVVCLTILALSAGALTACSSASAQPPANLISVSNGGCGSTWHAPRPGPYTFQIYNGSAESGEVDLVNPATSGIYAEVEDLGPGTTAPMYLYVGSGQYAFRCLFDDYDPMTGPTETVSGHVSGSPAILPVTSNDLLEPAKVYHQYVQAGLTTLAAQTATLTKDVTEGDLLQARTDWLAAHLTYERLGAAYDAFGNFDQEIDGRPDGLAGGVNSSQWTGFYRLEYGLWHGQSAAELRPVAKTLNSDVDALLRSWPPTEIDLLLIGLRTHEIMENALEFQLTGHDDYGSGTTLATTLANITGTRELLQVLNPLLAPRYAQLPAITTWLDRLQSLIEKYGYQNGRWFPVTALPTSIRQQIDAACDQALVELAPIAAITEPRST